MSERARHHDEGLKGAAALLVRVLWMATHEMEGARA